MVPAAFQRPHEGAPGLCSVTEAEPSSRMGQQHSSHHMRSLEACVASPKLSLAGNALMHAHQPPVLRQGRLACPTFVALPYDINRFYR